ncbi:MAG: hypothetical protein EOM35_03800 [Negativicutes bacterium]|nr:hypothetical protein [Negativicutes bacterium]
MIIKDFLDEVDEQLMLTSASTKAFCKSDRVTIRQFQLKRLAAKFKEQLNEAYRAGQDDRSDNSAEIANYLVGYVVGLFKLEDKK